MAKEEPVHECQQVLAHETQEKPVHESQEETSV